MRAHQEDTVGNTMQGRQLGRGTLCTSRARPRPALAVSVLSSPVCQALQAGVRLHILAGSAHTGGAMLANKWVFLRGWGPRCRGIVMILFGASTAELELNTLPERANSIHARSAECWLYTELTSIHRVYEQITHHRKAVKLLVALHYLYQQHSSVPVALHPN